MILVKRKHLYILTILFCILLVFGEIKYFFALKSVNLTTNMAIKYEVENFIFAAVVLVLIVFMFLVNFMRKSDNVLKKMDKMIELSEYGKHNIEGHLDKLGELGKKVNYLTFYLKNLNDMKTLKISSLSNMNGILMDRSKEKVFTVDSHGIITACNKQLAEFMNINKSSVVNHAVEDFFTDLHLEQLFFDLKKEYGSITKEKLVLKINGKEKVHRVIFYPVLNANNEVSNAIGIIEK